MASTLSPVCIVKMKRPHIEQQRFISSEAPRKIIRAGRRAGKTVGMAILAIQRFLKEQRVLYAAPTSDQVGAFWDEISRALAEPIHAGIFKKNETDHTIERPGTAQRIRAKTAWHPDHLRGDWCNLVILDEWQLQDPDCWTLVIAPMLLDQHGEAAFIWTPPSVRMLRSIHGKDPRHASKMFTAAQGDTTGRWAAFSFTSHDNPHLSRQALDEITQDMTALAYRQEILADDTVAPPGALWTQDMLDRNRIPVSQLPDLVRIAIALDPSSTSSETSDEMGIIAGGRGANGHGYTLKDGSLRGTPTACARAAIFVYDALQADIMIGEANNGGEWIGTVIQLVAENMHRNGERGSPHVNYKMVHASRGKQTRAEPIAVFSQQDRWHHVGVFPELEAQMTGWVPGMKSPDRMDAEVWLGTELLLGDTPLPSVQTW